MKISPVRARMIIWAIWRQSGRVGAAIDWAKVSATGRFLDGVKGTRCHQCKGWGEVPGYTYKQIEHKVVCQTCHGTGEVKLNKKDKKINPAFIKVTKHGIDDGEMLEIDRTMCKLRRDGKTLNFYLVLIYEYTRNGNQQIKADRVDVTLDYYKKHLKEAHRLMNTAINKYLISQPNRVISA